MPAVFALGYPVFEIKAMDDTLEMQIARESVQEFHDDPVMQAHYEAMECRDCEDFLAKGIRAYEWMRRAEETIREAVARGLLKFTGQADFVQMYYRWLGPCERAENLIKKLDGTGHIPDNLPQFRECCEQVRAWIEESEWRKLTTKASQARFFEEAW